MTNPMDDLMNGSQSIIDSQKQREMETDLQLAQMAQVTAESLSELAPDTGDMTDGDIVLPIDGSTSTVPTDSGFTGPFMSRFGHIFGGVLYQFGAVLAGVLGVGFNNQGQLVWGSGNVFADKLGLLFAVPGAFINFVNKAIINAVYVSSTYLMALTIEVYDQNGTDVITNGTAETGDTTGWTLAGTSPVASTDEAHSGTYSFKLTDATSAMLQTVGSFSGKHPVIPFWYKGGAVQASLEILDAASLQLGVSTLHFPAAAAWVPQSIAIANDFPTADKAKISFQAISATPVYIDDIKMLKLDSYAALVVGSAHGSLNDAIRARVLKFIIGNGSASAHAQLLDVRGTSYLGGDVEVAGAVAATGAVTGSNLSGTNTGDQTAASLGVVPNSGWTEVTGTWTYASASTITVPTDATTTYQKGDYLRWKQGGGYKYGTIAAITATLITIIVNADYSVANSAITDAAYSRAAMPLGWPDWFNWTPNSPLTGFSSNPANSLYRYSSVGRKMTVVVRQSGLGASNATTFEINAPVVAATITNGSWQTLSGVATDNTTVSVIALIVIASASAVFSVFKDNSGAIWTASGTKRVNFTITYEF